MEAGADAYMTKPFNLNVFKTTAENLIKNRERLKVSFAEPKVDESDIREVDIKTPDDRLLDRVVRIVNEHLGDPDLTVEQVIFTIVSPLETSTEGVTVCLASVNVVVAEDPFPVTPVHT